MPGILALASLLLGACHHSVAQSPNQPPIQRHGLASELLTEGTAQERQSEQKADLAIFYVGEHQGSMETCGCPKRPRGSLPRLAHYMSTHAAAHPATSSLLVHGGWWLSDSMGADGGLRADAAVMNKTFIEATNAHLPLSAANISYLDLPGLQGQPIPPWAVSANVEVVDPEQAPISASLIVQSGNTTVGITGITKRDESFVPSPAFRIEDPVESAVRELELMRENVDLLLLLVFDDAEAAKEIAARVPDLDVIVDTRQHRQHGPPLKIGETLWVKSHYQTMRLGELRLKKKCLSDSMSLVVDRKIDLDPEIKENSALKEAMKEARREIDAIQSELFGLTE